MASLYRVFFLSLVLVVLPGVKTLAATSPAIITPQMTPITVDETDKPIRVDGFLVDWPRTRMILLDQKSQVISGLLNWKSKDDFSGRIFLTYDENYLYLSAVVQKSSGAVNNNTGPGLWNGDCIELFLSTDSGGPHPSHITKGDYHIGFSPGTGGRNPQMFCFNKEARIGGGRVSARASLNGYILEACIPLTYFSGLQIGPGQVTHFDLALDEGGVASGSRILQMALSANSSSWKNPALWGSVQWTGKTQISVPQEDEENLYANLVVDGTKGSTYWGKRDITGFVTDGDGKPLSGATVSTWPRTAIVQTDSKGAFKIEKSKVYDHTVVYARLDGYATSLGAVERAVAPVKVKLAPLPGFLTEGDISVAGFYGQAFEVPTNGDLVSTLNWVQDWVPLLKLSFLKLAATGRLSPNNEEAEVQLDAFIAYARQMKAEPMIELPIHPADPEAVAEWVRHCNVEKGEKVIYWSIGEEPDLYAEKSADPNLADYNVYDYINDFRAIYNAVKRIDPTVLILGPDLAWRYTTGENDWFTPFLQFDGDIVNLASVHHYAAVTAADCTPAKVMDDVRHVQTITRGLKDRLAIHSDVFVPLVLTGGNVCLESTDNTATAQISVTPTATAAPVQVKGPSKPGIKPTPKPAEDAGPKSFWAALWAAEEAGVLMQDQMPMAFGSYLTGNGALDLFDSRGARPDYWALRMLSDSFRGKTLWAQAENKDVSVYAVQDPKTKDVTLLLINRGADYYHPKILLMAKDANVSVDAGQNVTYDLELPFYSIAVLKLRADRKPGTATIYTKRMAAAAKPPQVEEIHPW